MTEQVELSSFDLRYQGYRMQNRSAEKRLLLSVLEQGIREPLQGVDTKGTRILLNGFKRYRCAQQLAIKVIPYTSLADDEALGILELLRIANAKSLTILEQAKLIDELQASHGLCNAEIADVLEKSKAWVSVRTGMIREITSYIIDQILRGDFPAYSYLYTLRKFMRINTISLDEVEAFVRLVTGKGLSTRDIEWLAHGYFMGGSDLRQQISCGNITWALSQLKQSQPTTADRSSLEQSLLRDLEIVQKYMCRVISKSQHDGYQGNSFYAQANLLVGGIQRHIAPFSKAVEDFYDRTRQTPRDLPPA